MAWVTPSNWYFVTNKADWKVELFILGQDPMHTLFRTRSERKILIMILGSNPHGMGVTFQLIL